jgi:hypothetical protein
MRNANGEVPDAPRRAPCVIYLSDEAREALRRTREARRLSGQPQLLDSELVESLLIAYDRLPASAGVDSHRDVEQAVARLEGPSLRDFEQLVRKLRELELELAASRPRSRA